MIVSLGAWEAGSKAEFCAMARAVQISTGAVREKIQRRYPGAQQPQSSSISGSLLGVASTASARQIFTRYREQYRPVRERFA